MNEQVGQVVHDHWQYALLGFGGLVLFGLVGVASLVLFTRWVVHVEFGRLTSSLHDDIAALRASLSLIAKSEWTDISLSRKFADIDTVGRMVGDKLDEVIAQQHVLEDEQGALRNGAKSHGERLQVLETWKDHINDLTVIRGGF